MKRMGKSVVPTSRLAFMLVLALLVGMLLFGAFLVAGCDSDGPATTAAPGPTASPAAKLDKLTLVASPGPMAIPMAYMVINDKLADVAAETELVIWENAEQLMNW